jgi:hypothetical protein
MTCNHLRKPQCIQSSHCEWVKGKGCRSLQRLSPKTISQNPTRNKSPSLSRQVYKSLKKCELLKFDPVQLSDYELVKGRESSSASATDTYVVQSRETGDRYFIKLFVKHTDRSGKNKIPSTYYFLKNEIRVCRHLKCTLFDDYNVRNILLPAGEGKATYQELFEMVRLSSFNKLSDSQIKTNITKNSDYMLDPHKRYREPVDVSKNPERVKEKIRQIEKFNYKFMMTPLVKGLYENFGDFIKNSTWTSQSISKYMAILCYTLLQMTEVGVNQNDLHFGNILVNRKMFGPTLYYMRNHLIVTPTDTYIVDNEFTLFVFDFDRATVKGQYNTHLEDYAFAGNCPHYHEKRDMLKVICSLYKHTEGHRGLGHFRNDMLDKLVHNDFVYSKIKTYGDKHCNLEIDKHYGPAVACRNEYLDTGLSDNQDIVAFFFKHAKFQSVPTADILNNVPRSVEKVSQAIAKQFPKTTPSELKKYVKSNIQFSQGVKNRARILSILQKKISTV